jgi:hypothetical protein
VTAAALPRVGTELELRADMTGTLLGSAHERGSVAYTGDAIWLAFDQESYKLAFERWIHDRSGAVERPAQPHYDVSVILHDGRSVRSTMLRDVHVRYPAVQLLPHDEILIVGQRCRFSPDRSIKEDNAYVFGWDGVERRHFMLGDAIEDVQVDKDGEIWVSYFDEGVFGRVMWGGGDHPPAASGLIAVDGLGHIQWRYQAPDNVDGIDDCYALNVAEGATWVYYYSAFPLVRIGPDREIAVWRTDVTGARAIAVGEGRVLLVDAYWGLRTDAVLFGFGGDALQNPRNLALLRPGGDPLERPTTMVGRGPTLHVFDGPRWYQLDIRTLPV